MGHLQSYAMLCYSTRGYRIAHTPVSFLRIERKSLYLSSKWFFSCKQICIGYNNQDSHTRMMRPWLEWTHPGIPNAPMRCEGEMPPISGQLRGNIGAIADGMWRPTSWFDHQWPNRELSIFAFSYSGIKQVMVVTGINVEKHTFVRPHVFWSLEHQRSM